MEKTKVILIHLYIAAILSLLFMLAEIVGALYSNSLAVLNDSFYILSDILSFCISIIAIHISSSKSSSNGKVTFGYHRAEILGALLSMIIILGLTIMILCMSIERILSPLEIDGFIMLIYAVAGLAANILVGLILANSYRFIKKKSPSNEVPDSQALEKQIEVGIKEDDESKNNDCAQIDKATVNTKESNCAPTARREDETEVTEKARLIQDLNKEEDQEVSENPCFLFGSDDDEIDLNIRAAIIHMISDSIQSIGVIIASLFIYYDPSLVIFDPLCTILFSLVALGTTYPVLRDSLRILMQAVPKGYESDRITNDLRQFVDIINVHDIHLWGLNHEKVAFSCHLVSTENKKTVLERSVKILKKKHKLEYVTLQVEQQCFYKDKKCENLLHQ